MTQGNSVGCLWTREGREVGRRDCKRGWGNIYGNGYVQYFDCDNDTHMQNFTNGTS